VLVDEKQVTDAEGKVSSVKLSTEEVQALTSLVRDAVGYDEKRGDTVSVSNMAFYQAPPEAPAEEPGMLQSPGVQSFGKQALAAALILVVALVLVKPLLRALGGGGMPGLAGGAQPALATGGGGGYVAENRAPLSYDDKVSVARQLADRNPERVAQIVRAWVQSDG
jgi:flagellar M-ring protein FliF